jgi:hypothetical protein
MDNQSDMMTVRITREVPCEIRHNGITGKLQQRWWIENYKEGRVVDGKSEWRDVPTVEHLASAPGPNPECEWCRAGLNMASDNGGRWYHPAKDGSQMPHKIQSST